MSTSSNLLYQYSLNSSFQTIYNVMSFTPMSNLFFKNKKGLIFDAKVVQFTSEKWRYNPQLFCQDQYGSQHYYPIILIVNNIGSIYEFTKDTLLDGIVTPLLSTITKVINLKAVDDI